MRCKRCNGEMIPGFTELYCKAECDLKVAKTEEGYGGINCVLALIAAKGRYWSATNYLEGQSIEYCESNGGIHISSTLGELKKLKLKGLVKYINLTLQNRNDLIENRQLRDGVFDVLKQWGSGNVHCTESKATVII